MIPCTLRQKQRLLKGRIQRSAFDLTSRIVLVKQRRVVHQTKPQAVTQLGLRGPDTATKHHSTGHELQT
jgi:hypothetical protein